MLITVIAFLGVLAVLILVHELGHFVTAKASRVKVEELGLGFPPRLLSIKRALTQHQAIVHPTLAEIMAADEWAREKVRQLAGDNPC